MKLLPWNHGTLPNVQESMVFRIESKEYWPDIDWADAYLQNLKIEYCHDFILLSFVCSAF